MAKITLKGNPFQTSGSLPAIGSTSPDFILVKNDLAGVSLKDFVGKKKVLNIFPSLDTPVCAMSVRHFNEIASSQKGTVVLCISKDLPFAQARFCGAEGLKNVITLSAFRNNQFGPSFGIDMVDGPLAGLFARAVVVLDQNNKVIYTELVPEIAQEPNYQKALAVL